MTELHTLKKSLISSNAERDHLLDNSNIEESDIETGHRDLIAGQWGNENEICISQVRSNRRTGREESYNPTMVSIGPFHYNDKNKDLTLMSSYKLKYYQMFLDKSKKNGVMYEVYHDFVQSNEVQVRHCYEGSISDKLDFVNLMLIDSLFIIELFQSNYDEQSRKEEHATLFSQRHAPDLQLDLIKYENQIPIFLLVGLYNIAVKGTGPKFLELALKYFGNFNDQNKGVEDVSKARTFTELIVMLYLPVENVGDSAVADEGNDSLDSVHAAKVLDESGVRFQRANNSCLLDVTFHNGVLLIPQIKLDSNLRPLMHNLMTFENCHYSRGFISDYWIFMDSLISSSADVSVLDKTGILDLQSGDESHIAKLFNTMVTNTGVINNLFHYSDVSRSVNAYANKRRNRWLTTLQRNFFNSPWKSTVSIMFIIILLFTILKSVLAVMGYLKDK